jgi:hypothetical protein
MDELPISSTFAIAQLKLSAADGWAALGHNPAPYVRE